MHMAFWTQGWGFGGLIFKVCDFPGALYRLDGDGDGEAGLRDCPLGLSLALACV